MSLKIIPKGPIGNKSQKGMCNFFCVLSKHNMEII